MQIITARWFAMERDAIWQAFAETGDPVYYLLYKQTRNTKTDADKKINADGRGEFPRPED